MLSTGYRGGLGTRTARAVDAAGMVGLVVLGAWMQVARGTPASGLTWFLGGAALLFSVSGVLAWAATDSAGARRRLVCWALALKVAALACPPFFEDDYWRYLWDGYMTHRFGSPFGRSPELFFNDQSVPAEWAAVLGGINHPELPTIYSWPLQAAFAAAHAVAPAALWPLRVLWLLVDAVVVLLLARHAPWRGFALYALSPLVLYQTTIAAHPDGLVGALLLLAAVCTIPWIRGFLIGLAAACKIGAATALLPQLAARQWQALLAAVCAGAAIYVPAIVSGQHELAVLGQFGATWRFNGPVYELWRLIASDEFARAASAVSLAACWLAMLIRRQRPPVESYLLALLVCSPVFNAWYLLWLLPLAALRPRPGTWVLSLTVLFSYATTWRLGLSNEQLYELPAWGMWAQFGPPALIGLTGITPMVVGLARTREGRLP
jgi:hypothetical protein